MMFWRRVWIWKRRHKSRTTYSIQWLDERGWRRTEAVGGDRKRAEIARKRREMEINSGKFHVPQPIRLKAFRDEHIKLTGGLLSPRTVVEHREVLDLLLAQVGDVWLQDIKPRTVEALLVARLRDVRPATANKNLRMLRAVFQAAIRRGYLVDNPARAISQVPEAEKDIRVLDSQEVEKLVFACPDLRWQCFVFVALTTGLRLGELVNLEWSNVDLAGLTLRVRSKGAFRTKAGRNRTVPLVPELIPALRELREASGQGYVFKTGRGTPWRNNVRRGFKKILTRAGIDDCTVHDLRRTFVSQLANAGENEAVVQQLAGHGCISTTLRHYTRILPETLRRAPTRLPYVDVGFTIVTQLQRDGKCDRKTRAG